MLEKSEWVRMLEKDRVSENVRERESEWVRMLEKERENDRKRERKWQDMGMWCVVCVFINVCASERERERERQRENVCALDALESTKIVSSLIFSLFCFFQKWFILEVVVSGATKRKKSPESTSAHLWRKSRTPKKLLQKLDIWEKGSCCSWGWLGFQLHEFESCLLNSSALRIF